MHVSEISSCVLIFFSPQYSAECIYAAYFSIWEKEVAIFKIKTIFLIDAILSKFTEIEI